MRSIGFTGTRQGMTKQQKIKFLSILYHFEPELREFHHGQCVGSDFEACQLVEMFSCQARSDIYDEDIDQHLHPGYPADDYRDKTYQAQICLHPGTRAVHHLAKPFLVRNRDIVKSSDLMIATPVEKPLPNRGGTRYTVNFARLHNKPLIIIWPDGSTTQENVPFVTE